MSIVPADSNALSFEIRPGVRLRIPRPASGLPGFPTDTLQKGLVLEQDGVALSEEGVGFGLPLFKKGGETVFPGGLRVTLVDRRHGRVCVEYRMDLRERLSFGGSPLLKGPVAGALKDIGGLLHRAYPFARGAISGVSNAVRAALGVRTVFEKRQSAGVIRMDYRIDPDAGAVSMEMDATGIRHDGVREMIVMNEQGAGPFSEYVDSDGIRLRDQGIETWHRVSAAEASFRDPRTGILFSVRRVPGARLFRGREVVPGRLAWAGFAYVLPAGTLLFRCTIAVGVST